MGDDMSKKRKKKQPDSDLMTLSFDATPGATQYVIHGIAPIPVRFDADNVPSRIELTRDGYKLHGVKE